MGTRFTSLFETPLKLVYFLPLLLIKDGELLFQKKIFCRKEAEENYPDFRTARKKLEIPNRHPRWDKKGENPSHATFLLKQSNYLSIGSRLFMNIT